MTAYRDAPDDLPYSAELIAAAVKRIGAATTAGRQLRVEHYSDGKWRAEINPPVSGYQGYGMSFVGALVSLAESLTRSTEPKP